MEKIHTQILKSYENNEFGDMPSLDFSTITATDMDTDNRKELQIDNIKEICKKHGFNFCFIDNTFGGNGSHFFVYRKLALDADEFDALRKAMRKDERKRDEYWKIKNQFDPIYIALHECVNELDQYTDLFINYGWHGNCGVFGSHDVNRISYSGGDYIYSWEDILNSWDPMIHNTRSVLSRGVYVLIETHYIKPKIQQSPTLEEFEPKLLEIAKSLIDDLHTVDFETGKRGCDSTDYKAMVIRDKKTKDYCFMLRFNRCWWGKYYITRCSLLSGESKWVFDWENPTDAMKKALVSVIKD